MWEWCKESSNLPITQHAQVEERCALCLQFKKCPNPTLLPSSYSLLTLIFQARWQSRNKSERTPKRRASSKQSRQWMRKDLSTPTGRVGNECCFPESWMPPPAGALTAIHTCFKIVHVLRNKILGTQSFEYG